MKSVELSSAKMILQQRITEALQLLFASRPQLSVAKSLSDYYKHIFLTSHLTTTIIKINRFYNDLLRIRQTFFYSIRMNLETQVARWSAGVVLETEVRSQSKWSNH